MPRLYVFYLLFFILCCKKSEKFQFQKIGEAIFDIGFIANHRFIGITFDNSNSEDLFFFGDPVTRKIIKFFSMDGAIRFITPLQEARDSLQSIQHLQVISPDTILIFGQYNNQIAVINRFGKIWHYLDLNKLIIPYKNFNLNYVPSYGGSSMNNNVLYLNIEYLSKSKGEPTPDVKEYFSQALDVPFFLKISNVFDFANFSYKFGLYGFYRRFMTDSVAMGELVRYSVLNENIAVFSSFSDSIYIVDENTLEINSIFKISSDNTEIGANPINLFGDIDYSNYYEKVARYKGYISEVFEDPEYRLYIISITCENKKRIQLERDYSYCFYSKEGEKFHELFLKKEEYIPSLLYFNNSSYYMVPRKSVVRTDGKNIIKFESYEILY